MQVVKLFSEAVEEIEYVCEEKESGDKNYKIRGVFMQADIKNRNGRVYPMEILTNEVNRYNEKFIKETERMVNWDILMAQQSTLSASPIWLHH